MLYAIALSPAALRKLLPVEPHVLVSAGLIPALISGLIPMLAGQPFMTGLWLKNPIPVIGKVGTPLLIPASIWVVIGVVTWILLTLAEE